MIHYFQQGARCGHVEGKARAGQYVQGEEDLLSFEAAGNQGLYGDDRSDFAQGYRAGYQLGAEGSPIPPEWLA